MLFGCLEVMLEVFIPMLMSVIVDGGLYREEDFMLRELFSQTLIDDRNRFVITVGLIMIIVAIVSMTCGLIAARTSAVASQGFAKNLRSSLLEKIQSFSFANTDKFSTSSLITRATTDVNTMRMTMQMVLRILMRSPIMIIMSSVMAFAVAPHLASIFLLCIPVLAVILAVLMKIGQPRFKKMLRKMDGMNKAVQENLVSSRVVKAYVRGDYESEKFRNTAEELRNAQLASSMLFNLTGPIQMLIMWGCSVAILFVGGKEIIFENTGLLTGELVSLVSYTTQAVSSLTMLSWLIMSMSRAQASLVRINEVLDEEVDIVDGTSGEKVMDGSVDFDDVCFSYTKDENNLELCHIDLHIKSGETMGIIGGTGEGKSTLVNLIPRFNDALSGTVKVGGRDVKEYTLENLRDGVSMVLQNGSLFSGTIAENLRWGDPNATMEQMKEACYIACADEFIDSFKDGYETMLEQDGMNLSGGQRQRLRIARAIVKHPKILILDDSTSACDMTTDEHIRRALHNFMPGTTKIIIAQRIASIMTCDRIAVLDEGKLSDVGTHSELMERSAIYRDVYESQMREEDEQNAES
ncbi:MAG: ABC transporter ATP-binding protein [Oscillospiraceae bacterium]|nr:ABC transporter ATP-binding protein [Oscillospiraceae bacterium]